MGQGAFNWWRPFRSRGEKKYRRQPYEEFTLASSDAASHDYASFPAVNRPLRGPPDFEVHQQLSSENSSTIPFHDNSASAPASLAQTDGLFVGDSTDFSHISHHHRHHHAVAPLANVGQMGLQPSGKSMRRSRRVPSAALPDGPRLSAWKQAEAESRMGYARAHAGGADAVAVSMADGLRDPNWHSAVAESGAGVVYAGVEYADLVRGLEQDRVSPGAQGREPVRMDGSQPLRLDFSRMPGSFASNIGDEDSACHAELSSSGVMSGAMDKFVPHRPADRVLKGQSENTEDPRVSALTPGLPSMDGDVGGGSWSVRKSGESVTSELLGHGLYHKKLGGLQSRFIFRRRGSRTPSSAGQTMPPVHVPEDEYFGSSQHDSGDRTREIRKGEEVLVRFLQNALGPKAQNLAIRLMNKTPITTSNNFSYVINQATEDSDIDIIRRDLTGGSLYTSGVRLVGGGWCNLLLGDRFAVGASSRQRHELLYRRSACSCIHCCIRTARMVRDHEQAARNDFAPDTNCPRVSADVLSMMSSSSRTPTHSAMANFVVRYKLPSNEALLSIGASMSSRELEIGTVVRLNYRASAKLKFTDDVRELFGHFAYTGPISHEEVYRRVTTIGVHYYLYNKGKKERKVYIQGELIRLPVQVGVVKLGTQPMYMPELGATFCLHRKQIMSIYVGEIVLEGNSIGSFIKTGIRYYIGFGEERGVCPVYPNKTLGKARKLGVNELLLHHHMVDDLEVRCV